MNVCPRHEQEEWTGARLSVRPDVLNHYLRPIYHREPNGVEANRGDGAKTKTADGSAAIGSRQKDKLVKVTATETQISRSECLCSSHMGREDEHSYMLRLGLFQTEREATSCETRHLLPIILGICLRYIYRRWRRDHACGMHFLCTRMSCEAHNSSWGVGGHAEVTWRSAHRDEENRG